MRARCRKARHLPVTPGGVPSPPAPPRATALPALSLHLAEAASGVWTLDAGLPAGWGDGAVSTCVPSFPGGWGGSTARGLCSR